MVTPWTAYQPNLGLWWHSTLRVRLFFLRVYTGGCFACAVACACAYGRVWLFLPVLECGGARGIYGHPMGRSGATPTQICTHIGIFPDSDFVTFL